MILAFDTETTGLPDFKAPSYAPQQPHLVQLAMILLDDDMTERACVSVIVRPDGWEIPAEVAAIHGITTDMALKFGVPEKTAAQLYASMMFGTGAKAVGHNVQFDHRIMRIAMLRAGFTKERLDAQKVESFCTMNASTALVNLPPTEKMVKAGFNKPKAPKLSECIRFFFDEDLIGAHDALVDVRACLRIYQHLHRPAEEEAF
jgi:DNA polymerase-3 subunit epsilon